MSAPAGTSPDQGAARERALGIGLVLGAAVLWSSAGLFIKLLTLNGVALTGLRAGIAALTLAPFVRYRALRLDGTLLLLTVALAATQLGFVTSTRLTTAANAIALQSTAPAWVFAMGWLAQRRVQVPLLLPLALIGAGIAVMLSEPASGTSTQGNLLALGAGFTFAVAQVCFKRADQPALGAVMVANAGTALACLLIAPGAFQVSALPVWEWGVLLYLGAVQIGLAMLLYMVGVQRISVAQASVLILAEPLLNPLWVYLVLGEHPSSPGFVGFALILAGIVADFTLRQRLPSLRAQPLARDTG